MTKRFKTTVRVPEGLYFILKIGYPSHTHYGPRWRMYFERVVGGPFDDDEVEKFRPLYMAAFNRVEKGLLRKTRKYEVDVVTHEKLAKFLSGQGGIA